MVLFNQLVIMSDPLEGIPGHVPEKPAESGCKGYKYWTDCGYEYDCGYGTTITCEECKYCDAGGRKDPEAKCNQPKP